PGLAAVLAGQTHPCQQVGHGGEHSAGFPFGHDRHCCFAHVFDLPQAQHHGGGVQGGGGVLGGVHLGSQYPRPLAVQGVQHQGPLVVVFGVGQCGGRVGGGPVGFQERRHVRQVSIGGRM